MLLLAEMTTRGDQMAIDDGEFQQRTAQPRLRRDRGTTFVEILVAIVILGLLGVTILTALRTTILGSDQHKSKVAVLAELEGAGAYLQREANSADCAAPPGGETPDFYQKRLDGDPPNSIPPRPGNRNPGVPVVSVVSVDCTTGLPVVELSASHAKGNASESLDVIVGGISVVKNGDGTGGPAGPGPGPCTWTGAAATPPTVNKSGNQLAGTVTIRLSYTGNCSAPTTTALAYLSQPAPNPKSATLSMSDSGSGLFSGTLAPNAENWKLGVVNVVITTTGPVASPPFTTSFTVI